MAKRQDRAELKGSARAALPGGQDAGPADSNQQIEVSVLLRRRPNPSQFPPAAHASATLPQERRYLTRKEFARLHGASAADVKKVRAFAGQYGLRVVNEDRASRMVKLSGKVQEFNEAFGTDLRRYEHSSGAYRCRTGSLTIPGQKTGVTLREIVETIENSAAAFEQSVSIFHTAQTTV